MRKVYNFLLITIIVLIIIVIGLIVIKYGKNRINENLIKIRNHSNILQDW